MCVGGRWACVRGGRERTRAYGVPGAVWLFFAAALCRCQVWALTPISGRVFTRRPPAPPALYTPVSHRCHAHPTPAVTLHPANAHHTPISVYVLLPSNLSPLHPIKPLSLHPIKPLSRTPPRPPTPPPLSLPRSPAPWSTPLPPARVHRGLQRVCGVRAPSQGHMQRSAAEGRAGQGRGEAGRSLGKCLQGEGRGPGSRAVWARGHGYLEPSQGCVCVNGSGGGGGEGARPVCGESKSPLL